MRSDTSTQSAIEQLNGAARHGDADAFHHQQLLLSRIYQNTMQLPEGSTTAESALLHKLTRLLEVATITTADHWIDPSILDSVPIDPEEYVSWLEDMVRAQPYRGDLVNSDTQRVLSGNLAVLLRRYRHLMYAEAVGYLGMTELHDTIDSQHAAGWFHTVVRPAAGSAYMRRGIARGVLWRVSSAARHLDERSAHTRPATKAA